VSHPAEVVDPQDVVVLGLADVAQQLPLELLVDDVVVLVPAGELLAHRALDEPIELGLGLELVGTQRQVDRDPDQLGGLPIARGALAILLDGVQQRLEHVAQGGASAGGNARFAAEPEIEAVPRSRRIPTGRVGLLDAAQHGVVGKHHVFEQDLARLRRDLAPELGALAHSLPRRSAARREREGAVELLVVDGDLRGVAAAVRIQGAALGHVLLEALDPPYEALDGLLAAAARGIEEGRGEAVDPVCGIANVREGLGELRVHGVVALGALLRERQADVVPRRPGTSHPGLEERDGEAHLEGVAPRREVVDAQAAAKAEGPTPAQGMEEGEQEVGIVVADVVVHPHAESERPQREEAPEAPVDRGSPRPHVALGGESKGGDRAQHVVEGTQREAAGRVDAVARGPVCAGSEPGVGEDARGLAHGFDPAALVGGQRLVGGRGDCESNNDQDEEGRDS
jgi:hypothetical protein